MSSKLLKTFLLSLILFFIFIKPAKASFSFNISSPSATLITSGGQDIEVSLNITDLPSESYFRVSLQKESGGSYYGYVQNHNSEWSKVLTLSGDCLNYYKVFDLQTTLVNLKFKIGDDLNLDNGNYLLKGHRFTKTCTSYTEALNTIPIVVNLPTLIPTQAPTAQPTSAPTTTPTATTTLKPTPSMTSTPKATTTPTPKEEATENANDSNENQIITESETSTPTSIGIVAGAKTENKSKTVAIILISIGIGFLGYCGYLIYNGKNAKTQNTP